MRKIYIFKHNFTHKNKKSQNLLRFIKKAVIVKRAKVVPSQNITRLPIEETSTKKCLSKIIT